MSIGNEAELNRQFVDALREVPGLAPLHDTKQRPPIVRFNRDELPDVQRSWEVTGMRRKMGAE